ncbi:MAG TPA: topoisomerase DNA-binding C4 zinc finger domain-containing protein [Phycisphaerae bacterium]|nr:topoisomerase DNA-binding C4 zinc finger domain-containing protein [Phycisphaerae bacterium]
MNEHGEWGRIHNRRFTPVESPLEQSRRHKETLYSFMTAHREEFMGKLLGFVMVKHFERILTPVHYVAISTHGQIQGSGRRKFPEVKKADQIPHEILAHHQALNTGLLNLSAKEEDMDAFNKVEFAAVIQFLGKHDVAPTPLDEFHRFAAELPQLADRSAKVERDASETELAAPADEPVERHYACRKCESKNIAVTHGPYGYYFKCGDCGGNTPIVELCGKCSEKLKVSKSGADYSLICPKCGQSTPLQLSGSTPGPVSAPNPADGNAEPGVLAERPPADGQPTPPTCPLCGATMTLRTARRGKKAGDQFWGCQRYPKCKGIAPVS